MKLDYLSDDKLKQPILRLSHFTTQEIERLNNLIIQLAAGEIQRIEIHKLEGVDSVQGCQLTFCLRTWDQSTIRMDDENHFECGFMSGTWDNIASLMEPFLNGSNGFQWLAGVPGEASLLLSPSGNW